MTVDRHARALLGEPFVALVELQLRPDEVEQVLRVAAVVDREAGIQADRLAVQAQQAGGGGMKGPAPELAAHRGSVAPEG
jgi:hypothetical protein